MSLRFLWLSDIHLNFVEPDQFDLFCQDVLRESPDGILLGGDIGESHDVAQFLIRMDDCWQVPIYFVLGNHDFYRSSLNSVRMQISQLCNVRSRLHYLTQEQLFSLSDETALIGHDGWADARVGNYTKSQIFLNDYYLIEELANLTKKKRLEVLQQLGDDAAKHIAEVLPQALAKHQNIILLTHVPPLREACWHLGNISDDDWSPHFVCQAIGEVILSIMKDHPQHQLTVLCGHTHSSGQANPLPNLKIYTAAAEYRNPTIQRIFEVEDKLL